MPSTWLSEIDWRYPPYVASHWEAQKNLHFSNTETKLTGSDTHRHGALRRWFLRASHKLHRGLDNQAPQAACIYGYETSSSPQLSIDLVKCDKRSQLNNRTLTKNPPNLYTRTKTRGQIYATSWQIVYPLRVATSALIDRWPNYRQSREPLFYDSSTKTADDTRCLKYFISSMENFHKTRTNVYSGIRGVRSNAQDLLWSIDAGFSCAI